MDPELEQLVEGSALVASSPVWRVYELRPGTLFVVPEDGAMDEERHAATLLSVLTDYSREMGRAPAVLAAMDRWGGHRLAARRYYAREYSMSAVRAAAMITRTAFGNAVASLFLGMYRANLPVASFRSLGEANAWLASLDQELP